MTTITAPEVEREETKELTELERIEEEGLRAINQERMRRGMEPLGELPRNCGTGSRECVVGTALECRVCYFGEDATDLGYAEEPRRGRRLGPEITALSRAYDARLLPHLSR